MNIVLLVLRHWDIAAVAVGALTVGYAALQLRSTVLACVACALLGGAVFAAWTVHSTWDEATAHYSAVVNACLSANAANATTIKQLQAANDQWAADAKAQAAQVAQAVKDADAAKAANAKALATAQAKLAKVIHDQGDAHAWGVTHVPAGVLDALGLRPADRPH